METRNNKNRSVIGILAVLLTAGCAESDQTLSPLKDLSVEAKSFLEMRNGVNQGLSMEGNNQNAVINKSFQGAYNSYASVSGATGVAENADSTVLSDPIPWETCATVTETTHADGSTTVVTDYGDGCTEGYGDFKYFMFGKYTYTFKYDQSQNGAVFTYKYYNRNIAENYGGSYNWDGNEYEWLNNGRSTYLGESEYDSIKQTFSGFYIYSDTSEYVYDHTTYFYKSNGESFYDEKKSVTKSNSFEYSYGSDYYKSVVLKPLVMDYSCFNNMITELGVTNGEASVMPFWSTYVSGRERVQYKHEGMEGEFEIDYGNGECDNVITIYEHGKVFKIDMSVDYVKIANGG